MNRLYKAIYQSPFGTLNIVADKLNVLRVDYNLSNEKHNQEPNNIINETTKQLDEYFAKSRKVFDLPIENKDLKKSEFFYNVQKQLTQIPLGSTLTYKQIAQNIDNPKAYRAVGLACNKNPISIIIPCHRVIGSNNKLTGYAGGLDMKQKLLEHEASFN